MTGAKKRTKNRVEQGVLIKFKIFYFWIVESKRLWPRATDLGYHHWRIGITTCNDSVNYKVSFYV